MTFYLFCDRICQSMIYAIILIVIAIFYDIEKCVFILLITRK